VILSTEPAVSSTIIEMFALRMIIRCNASR
jgi:hypothetical protein